MSKQEFLTTSGIEGQTLQFWIEQEWLIPQDCPSGPTFTDRDLARARLIGELKRDLGVNDEGIDVVLHLMDQLHGLRRALAFLHGEMLRKPT